MLTHFGVRNYKSIRRDARIDLVADNRLGSRGTPPGKYNARWKARILPAIALFGQNGSGKSNVLFSLFDLFYLMLRGAVRSDVGHMIYPFMLDERARKEPISFLAGFAVSDTLLNYELSILRENVVAERLEIQQAQDKKPRLVFDRKTPRKGTTWSFGDDLNKATQQLAKDLKPGELFLSFLFRIDIPWLNALKDHLIKMEFPFTPRTKDALTSGLLKELRTNRIFQEKVRTLLCLLDVNVTQISHDKDHVHFFHPTPGGRALPLPFDVESDGTQHLLVLGASVIKALEGGGILIVDELDAHLHPLISHQLISFFQDPNVNKENAQLIFSTHDTTILDQELLRRDQVYFVNRTAECTTELRCLAGFRVRKDLVVQKAYLEGRLSGLPVLRYNEQIKGKIKSVLHLRA